MAPTDRTITAAAGAIRWGYHLAGRLRGVTVTRTGGAWAVGATLEAGANPVYLAQSPLKFEIVTKTGVWAWVVRDIQIAGATLSASLGLPEI